MSCLPVRLLPALSLSILMLACGQPPSVDGKDPYANGQSYPWQQTGMLRPQSLTPGVNTLQYETATFARNSWGRWNATAATVNNRPGTASR